jgi:type II secretory pathway pseudopilin PulG
MMECKGSHSERGFVLPYVLVVIAILSAISILGVNTIRERTADLSVLIENHHVERAIEDAEEIVTYTFLTRPMTTRGLDVSNRFLDPSTILPDLLPDESDVPDNEIWKATGELRRLNIRGINVDVFYRDISGLISLNSASESVIETWLSANLEQPSLAKSLAAKLRDYRDPDNRRGFLGGERADYRFRTLPPPSNSSLRTIDELNRVIDWELTPTEYARVLKHFSVLPMAGRPALQWSPDDLVQLYREEVGTVFSRGRPDLVDEVILNSRLPSEGARFIFFADGQSGSPPLQRIVEFERTTGAPNLPRQRRTVADGVMLVDKREYTPNDDVKQLPVSRSSNDQ